MHSFGNTTSVKSVDNKKKRRKLKTLAELAAESNKPPVPKRYSDQKSVQKFADKTLDHLLADEQPIEKFAKWAAAESFNNAVRDATMIKCYVCGTSGHFMEVCPLYQDLNQRFGNHGVRSAMLGRAILEMTENQSKK